MEAAARAFEQDPETTKLAALLESWYSVFGSMQTTVGLAIRRADTDERLGVAMEDIAGQAGKVNSRMLGRWIERMTGRIVGGKLFSRVGLRSGVLHWAVNLARHQGEPPSALTQRVAEEAQKRAKARQAEKQAEPEAAQQAAGQATHQASADPAHDVEVF